MVWTFMILGHVLPKKLAMLGVCSGVVAGISNFQALCHALTWRKTSYGCCNENTNWKVEKLSLNSNCQSSKRQSGKEHLDFKRCLQPFKYVSHKNTAYCLEYQEGNEIAPTLNNNSRRLLNSFMNKLLVFLRAICLLIRYGILLVLYPIPYFLPNIDHLWWNVFLKTIETSGPTFVKLGQWLSTRHDIFSEKICNKLAKFHIQVTPHSWKQTEDLMTREFGLNWETSFVGFSESSLIGSGAIAQVYKAYIIPNDSDNEMRFENVIGDRPIPVAVKVRHPDVAKAVHRDISLLRFFANFLEKFFFCSSIQWLRLNDIVNEFEKTMISQIDMTKEAVNLDQFRVNFESYEKVKFPQPLYPYVTEKVLVETFEKSVPVTRYLNANKFQEIHGTLGRAKKHQSDHANEMSTVSKQQLAKIMIHLLLKMVFIDNFVHGDLHPGNILIQELTNSTSPKEKYVMSILESYNSLLKYSFSSLDVLDHCASLTSEDSGQNLVIDEGLKAVIVDTGSVCELSPVDRQNFRDVFTAVVNGNGRLVATLILERARCQDCSDIEKFKTEVASLVNDALQNTVSLGSINFGVLLTDVFSLIVKHRVAFESNFTPIVMAVTMLEGVGRSLDPEMDLLQAAAPYLLIQATRQTVQRS